MSKAEKQKVVAAVYLVLVKDGKVLLLRRFNTGYEDGKYSLVAGHVDVGESAKRAMVREAMEEAGIVVEEDHLEVVHIMHRKALDPRIDIFMRATEWEKAPRNMEPEKCDHLGWFDFAELPENILPYVCLALEKIAEGERYCEFGW